jgi:hypothetical protein
MGAAFFCLCGGARLGLYVSVRVWSAKILPNGRSVSPPASYLIRPQVTKGLGSWFAASFVSVPSLRRRSVGPPPSAIHGGGRLSRHPCRSTHSTTPAFGLHPSRDLSCLGYCVRRSRSRSTANTAVRLDAIPVGDAGGHDGSDSGLSVANESPDLLSSSERGPGCRTTSTGFRVPLEIWIRHVIAARLIRLWLTPDLFRLRRVT